jgi:hypothetical protein
MNIAPEWSTWYIAYNNMNLLLHEAAGKIVPPSKTDRNQLRQPYSSAIDEAFFQVRKTSFICMNCYWFLFKYCEQEISKVDTFFTGKLAE